MPKSGNTRTAAPSSAPASTLEERLVAFAAQLGQVVGNVQARADGWLDRETLNSQLTRVRDGAAELLNQLGAAAASATAAASAARKQARAKAAASGGTSAKGDPPTRESASRSRGKAAAPGKTHRKPPPSARGVKSSNQMIPKAKAAEQMRQRRHF
jgi:hypothetical protein